jgi:cytochrome c-type biogenesis protein
MLSFLSPCVLPLVPAYLSMVSGLSAAELGALGADAPAPEAAPAGAAAPAEVAVTAGLAVPAAVAVTAGSPAVAGSPVVAGATPPAPSPRQPEAATVGVDRRARSRLLYGILSFIAGFTVVFTILGASASAVGRLFLTHQRALETASGVLIVVFGVVLVAMAAGVTLPAALVGERRFAVRPSVLGAWAPPLMGMAFAFGWTPCIGPVLGSVLALAAGTGGSTTGGIALLLAYSLGLGVPFLLSGLAFGQVTAVLARVRSRLFVVDLVAGAVLVAFGLLLLTGHVGSISAVIADWLRDLHLTRLTTS